MQPVKCTEVDLLPRANREAEYDAQQQPNKIYCRFTWACFNETWCMLCPAVFPNRNGGWFSINPPNDLPTRFALRQHAVAKLTSVKLTLFASQNIFSCRLVAGFAATATRLDIAQFRIARCPRVQVQVLPHALSLQRSRDGAHQTPQVLM